MTELKEKRHEGKPGPFCGRCPYRDEKMVPGYGPSTATYMVLGDFPGVFDARKGRLFTGMSGKRLEKQFSHAKLFLSDCWLGSVVRCHVPSRKNRKKATPTPTSVKCCRPLLEADLDDVQPTVVITLGTTAFGAFYDGLLTAYHGARIQGDGYVLVPMFAPDAHDDNPDLLRVIYQDYRGLRDRPQLEAVSGNYRMAVFQEPTNDRYAVDTETTGLDLRSRLLGMGVAHDTGEAVYTPDNQVPRGRYWLGHATMHHAKYDLGVLDSNGVSDCMEDWEWVDDTMLLAYCMNKKPLGLKPLAIQELHLEQVPFKDVAHQKSLVNVDPEIVATYCCADADLTLRLWDYLWKLATARERRLYLDIERPLPPVFAAMQLRGVHVDVEYFEELAAAQDKQLALLARRIRQTPECGALVPEVLSSPTRLSTSLSALLRIGLRSSDKFALDKVAKRHPVIPLIQEWRELYKLKTAFVDSILGLERGGMVYPEFGQTATSTGRLNCKGPNLQQLPKKTKTIREGFPAPEGYVVVTIDNSQIDLRSLAYLSQDEEMLRCFAEGLDMHSETSTSLLGSAEEDMRRIAKTANFLVVFGGGADALAMKTGADPELAYNFMDAYWERHPGVKAWVEATHAKLVQDGFVETVYGRRRYIPKVYTRERGAAFREGQNMPVQGTSADVLKLQTLAVSKTNVGALMFGQIHDELDLYVPADRAEERIRVLVKAMESVDCPFDLKVEAMMGPNLGDQTKVAL
jgi:DNA polymerase-1